jgi:hypothetical protein
MSQRLISRNEDLLRLQNEGYSLDIVGGKLLLRDVPFVDSDRIVHHDGILVMPLELAGEVVKPPADHTASFGGGIPCTSTGATLTTVVNGHCQSDLGHGIVITCTCSMKPVSNGGKYPDFYKKVTNYVAAIAGHASALNPDAKATVFRPIPKDEDNDSPFKYVNTASSRAGIDALNAKLHDEHIAIVGLGGTGEYILDFVAKTEVETIDVFDGDDFRSHNAFRAPGAPTLEELNAAPLKVDYFLGIYSRMREGIITHGHRIDETNVHELREMTFVFIAIDDAPAKAPIIRALTEWGIPFIDVGMGVDEVDGHLTGSLRTAVVTPEKNDHASVRIPVIEVAGPDDYKTNIQIAELNARNATDAVIAWKQYRGFYADLGTEHFSVYSIATNHIINGDPLVIPDIEDVA